MKLAMLKTVTELRDKLEAVKRDRVKLDEGKPGVERYVRIGESYDRSEVVKIPDSMWPAIRALMLATIDERERKVRDDLIAAGVTFE